MQFSKKIRSDGGIAEFEVIDLMEWFMKSMIDLLSAMDYAMSGIGSSANKEWPTMQTLKNLFVDIVKPIEQLVVHLFPLPPYKLMR